MLAILRHATMSHEGPECMGSFKGLRRQVRRGFLYRD
jgi:hypothetical protein